MSVISSWYILSQSNSVTRFRLLVKRVEKKRWTENSCFSFKPFRFLHLTTIIQFWTQVALSLTASDQEVRVWLCVCVLV